jgi:NADP-dependent 3-hydroxy acid dehydrogenase YdfG
MTDKVWLITGASTGLGRVLAEQVLAAGGQVAATARKPEQLSLLREKYGQAAFPLALDVTEPESVEDAVAQVQVHFGRIDVLVNNAGYGLVGAIEEASNQDIRQVFETNVFGLLRVTRAVLPGMRERRSGHILNLSSIGGLIASPGLGYYNATKFAVEAISESLTGELKPLGIRVTVVEPGPFRTDFLGRSGVISETQIADYNGSAGNARKYFAENDGKQKGDPARAAQAMIAAVDAAEAPKHLLLGRSAWERMSARAELWQKDLEAGREVALAADFPDAEAK